MRRPRILMDVDGPLTRGFFVKVCEYLRDEGVAAHPDLIDRWNVFEAFGVGPEVERIVRDRLCLAGVARGFAQRPGAGPFLAELRTWADVYAVTAPFDGSPTWAHDRESWLRDRLGFTANHVVHARDKHLIAGDALIDDRVSTLRAWRDAHPGFAIAWHETHNAADGWNGPRVRDYDELRAHLEYLRRLS